MGVTLMEERDLQSSKLYLAANPAVRSGELAESWIRFHAACEEAVARTLAFAGLGAADRDDCLQEIWLEIVSTRLEKFRGNNVLPWVIALARNKAVDVHRRRSRRRTLPLDFEVEGPAPAGPHHENVDETRRRAWRALAELEGRTSVVSFLTFFLRQVEGLSVSEVAEFLHLSPSQVRLRHHRVKCRLRGTDEARMLRAAGETR
jgi:RNA polymerase sigma-70 factor (ECF subfamily)